MGLQITEGFKKTSPGLHFAFFPNVLQLFPQIFIPAMRSSIIHIDETASFETATSCKSHMRSLFDHNEEQTCAELQSFLATTRGSRKRDVVLEFAKYAADHPDYVPTSNQWFLRKEDIDSGTYRRETTSAVVDDRFLNAVRSAFARGDSGEVTLSQLEFASTKLIREYVELPVVPSLYQIVPDPSEDRKKTAIQAERHALLCASLSLQLDEQCESTSEGWKTELRVISDFKTNLPALTDFQRKVGSRRV